MDKLNPALKQGSDPDRDKRDPALEARLREQFRGCCFGGVIHAYAVCDSTMERAHALAREGAGEGTLVFALRQTQGRGRLGRKWESPAGGAYFSLILKPTRPPAELPQLSLIAGLAVAETIQWEKGSDPSPEKGSDPFSVSIRWPNDILINGKKVAGILLEASSHSSTPCSTLQAPSCSYVVLGIGINVTTDPKELPETATSLEKMVPGSERTRGAWHLFSLVAAVCTKFDGWYDIWATHGFVPIREALRSWLNLGGLVRLTTGGSQVEGQAADVDEHGRLLVRLESGVMRTFEAGEVTLLC